MHRSADDLSVLSRRKALSAPEERRFQVYLGASDDARLFHEMGCDYDRMHTARPGDAALLARVRGRLLERYAGNTSRERRRFRLPLLVAFGVLSAGVAGAAVGILGHVTRATVEPATTSATVNPPHRSAPAALDKGVPEHATAAAPGAAAPANASPPVERAPRSASVARPAPLAEIPNVALLDPRELFSRANAERKAGKVDEALLSYAELRRAFPRSPEATLSHVLSGRLLFGRGDASRAAAEFGAYLARNPKGTLAEEALHGQAEAFRALGRSAEERGAWERLLERFPGSIHAATARERLSRDR
ncbi:MAG TPA: tetratricopeptide repeat protein [Polyangiaceae bacterium]